MAADSPDQNLSQYFSICNDFIHAARLREGNVLIQRRRLRERCPSTALEQLDRAKCVIALYNYRELLEKKDICGGNCTRADTFPKGVCNIDNTKGFFRRRRSSARRPTPLPDHNKVATTQSCPSSPCHAINLQRSASINMETQSITETVEVFESIQENTNTTTTTTTFDDGDDEEKK